MARAAKKPRGDALGGLSPRGNASVRCPEEARLLRSCEALRRQMRPMTDPERAMYVATREAAALLSADDFCFAVVSPGAPVANLLINTGAKEAWDAEMLAQFARGEQREPPERVALARVKRRGRPWGAVAVRWDHASVTWDLRNALTRFVRHANDVIADIERDRLLDVRAKIDRKIMEQLRSRDLFYQILDGLRSLTGYDHSATILIGEANQSSLEIAAEKIAWRHGKSHRVGVAFEVSLGQIDALHASGVSGFTRGGEAFVRWKINAPADKWLQSLLDQPCTRSDQEPRIGETLIAPLAMRDGLRAVLVVSTIHPGQLGEYEVELVSSFLPQVAISLQNSRWAEAMEAEMLETERKHAMADLARGVAHDVNNALGATLPLLQQMRDDLANGRMDQPTLALDVEQIQRSVQVCRDIFGGMLRFARTAARPQGTASIRAAVENGQMILRAGLRRRNIQVSVNLPEPLPALGMSQSELEQLLINLMTNSMDAMEGGGALTISAELEDATIVIEVNDTGVGIPQEHLARVQDPFFTTKTQGSGLGLSICRSIVWRSHGTMTIESTVGRSTCVTLELPVAEGIDVPAAAPAVAEVVVASQLESAVEEHAHPGG